MPKSAAPIPFAARLRQLREQAGLGVAELAERAGLARAAVYHYESGIREPAWDPLCRLADALGVSLDAFRRVSRSRA